VDWGNEPINIEFNGFSFEDPALGVDTESFMYRWDYGDGIVSDWAPTGGGGGGAFIEDFEQGSGWMWPPWQTGSGSVHNTVGPAYAHDGIYGSESGYAGTYWYYRTDVSVGNPGDVLSCWARPQQDYGRMYLGFAATSGGCYSFVLAPNTDNIIIQRNSNYGYYNLATSSYPPYVMNQWYKLEVVFDTATQVTGNLYDQDGTTLLATVTYDGIPGLPAGIAFRGFGYMDMDSFGTGAGGGAIPDVSHEYGDNGIYAANLQVIDDDMWWDFSGPQPVFTGPGAEEDWIVKRYFPVEVLNVDPEISRVAAYADVNLNLRMAGTKTHEATMTLYTTHSDGSVTEVSVTVQRDPGKPDVGTLGNVRIDMTPGTTYEIQIVCTPESGNPTWVFDTSFPDGKFKELHHTFSEGHGWTWVIPNALLKSQMVGAEIMFEADAFDPGSDDLTFMWSYGDGNYGINVYANKLYPGSTAPVPGELAPAPNLNDVLGGDAEPKWPPTFSPRVMPIRIGDQNSHVFEESAYYYVMLLVADDDIQDDYPSAQMFIGGGGYDMEFVEIALG
jgi:hypothetical protein